MTTLKETFEKETNLVGAWLSIGHPTVAEVTAAQGFDFVLIDTEHTPIGLETLVNMSRGVEAIDGNTETLVRVPSNDPVRIKRVLDIGVSGIMVPMVESVAEAKKIVDAVRYPPSGMRGVASGRASEYGDNFQDYVESANGSITIIVQIENQLGIENVDEIATIEGIDGLFVGPADLSANLGIFAKWENEQLSNAIKTVINAGNTADVPVGTLVVSPDDIEMRIKQGFDYLIVGKDTNHLSSANEAIRQQYENVIRDSETTIAEE